MRSSDLNQPNLFADDDVDDGVSPMVLVCSDELLVLFCDGVRFGSGLAFGVDKRRRVEMSDNFMTEMRRMKIWNKKHKMKMYKFGKFCNDNDLRRCSLKG